MTVEAKRAERILLEQIMLRVAEMQNLRKRLHSGNLQQEQPENCRRDGSVGSGQRGQTRISWVSQCAKHLGVRQREKIHMSPVLLKVQPGGRGAGGGWADSLVRYPHI